MLTLEELGHRSCRWPVASSSRPFTCSAATGRCQASLIAPAMPRSPTKRSPSAASASLNSSPLARRLRQRPQRGAGTPSSRRRPYAADASSRGRSIGSPRSNALHVFASVRHWRTTSRREKGKRLSNIRPDQSWPAGRTRIGIRRNHEERFRFRALRRAYPWLRSFAGLFPETASGTRAPFAWFAYSDRRSGHESPPRRSCSPTIAVDFFRRHPSYSALIGRRIGTGQAIQRSEVAPGCRTSAQVADRVIGRRPLLNAKCPTHVGQEQLVGLVELRAVRRR